jgi:hypothetical protein
LKALLCKSIHFRRKLSESKDDVKKIARSYFGRVLAIHPDLTGGTTKHIFGTYKKKKIFYLKYKPILGIMP